MVWISGGACWDGAVVVPRCHMSVGVVNDLPLRLWRRWSLQDHHISRACPPVLLFYSRACVRVYGVLDSSCLGPRAWRLQ